MRTQLPPQRRHLYVLEIDASSDCTADDLRRRTEAPNPPPSRRSTPGSRGCRGPTARQKNGRLSALRKSRLLPAASLSPSSLHRSRQCWEGLVFTGAASCPLLPGSDCLPSRALVAQFVSPRPFLPLRLHRWRANNADSDRCPRFVPRLPASRRVMAD